MRTTGILLALLLLAAPALAQGPAEKKQQVLDKIDSLIDEGDLDKAGRMIDFFLDKNPGDKDLVRRKEKWRIAKGEVGPLLKEEGLATPEKRKRLREVCWKIVAASMKGNPDEWEALLGTGVPEKAKELLEDPAHISGLEDERISLELRIMLDGERSPVRSDDELKAALAADNGRLQIQALKEIEKRKLKAYRAAADRLFKDASDLSVRYSAAAVLLALGDEKPRKTLMKSLRAQGPFEATIAMEILVCHPGKGKAPLIDLYRQVESDEEILRAKPALLSIAIGGIGERKEQGALEFLTRKLAEPAHAVDAARALGALGDDASVGRLLAFLREPPRTEEDDTTGSGLGFLGGQGKGVKDAAAAEELRPRLVGALAILRVTAPKQDEKEK